MPQHRREAPDKVDSIPVRGFDSGLAVRPPTTFDNVWHVDCSSFFPPAVEGMQIHSAYFDTRETLSMMRELLRGIDRTILATIGPTKGTAWP